MRVEMNLDVQHCHDDMDSRIAEFKQDSDKMNELNLFLDNVLDEAQKSAEIKIQCKMMTLKQLTNSMDMMRQACAPKFKVEEGNGFVY
uniref:Uncharacterized protein n=1 Tax=Anopheles atroparvus TaxID=41427 RepID=A0A182JFM1_ANOAO